MGLMSEQSIQQYNWSPFSTPLLHTVNESEFAYFQFSSLTKNATKIIHPTFNSMPQPISKPAKINRTANNRILRSQQVDISEFMRNVKRPKRALQCSFCKSNGESHHIYTSHSLKSPIDNKITCPILQNYSCGVCGVRGEHTIKYCPVMQKQQRMKLLNNFVNVNKFN